MPRSQQSGSRTRTVAEAESERRYGEEVVSAPQPSGPRRGVFEPGDTVADRYRIGDVIGRGGAATVYRATPFAGGAAVALKTLNVRNILKDRALRRFSRETSLAQALKHPNIVAPVDFGMTNCGVPFIAFELLHGSTIRESLRRQGRLHLAQVVALLDHFLDALEFAHARNVVHRDIKPSNLFVCDDPARTGKVLDFGIARLVGFDTIRAGTAAPGTPAYSAPEQLRGEEIDGTADLFALGLVAAEMLGGDRVYVKRDPTTLRRPIALAPDVFHSPLGPIIERAVEIDPAKRWPSATDMLREVRALEVE